VLSIESAYNQDDGTVFTVTIAERKGELALKNRSLLLKLIIFGTVLSILPVVILGMFSYIQSSNQVQKQVNHAEMQYLQLMRSNVEQVLKTVEHTLTNLLESKVMEEAMYSPLQALDFQLYNNLRSEIIHLQSFDTGVYEVFLVNKRQNWLIRNDGIARLDLHPDAELHLRFLEEKDISSWQLLRNEDYVELDMQGMACEYTVSHVRQLPLIRTEKFILAFANISACGLSDKIFRDLDNSEVMVVDSKQIIVAHPDHAMIGKQLSEHPVFRNGISLADRSGQMVRDDSGEPYAVTYLTSDYNNWSYISVLSIDQLTEESRRIGWFTWLISMVIIGLSIITVWVVTKRLYRPVDALIRTIQRSRSQSVPAKPVNEMQLIQSYIEQLYSSNTKLEHDMREHARLARVLFLSRLYSGDARWEEIAEKLDQFELSVRASRWRLMAVLTLQVDTLDNTHYDTKDLGLLSFAVSNIVEETIDQDDRFPTVWLDRTLVILIGFAEQDETVVKERLYKVTESLKSLIQQYLRLSVSIGISTLFDQIRYASRAYEEGIEALKHRLILGKGVIVPYGEAHQGKSTVVNEYPVRIEHELIDEIKLADQQEALRLLKDWMREAVTRIPSPTDYQVSVMRLLNRLMMLKQEVGISFEQLGIYKTSLYDEVLSLHMSQEIEHWFSERLIVPMVQVFSERRNSQYHSLSEQMIDLIQQHVDKELTLDDCAAILHYNASYLSSVFKNETGLTFSEYLSQYRLQVAKDWLMNTDMTIREIAERLQYSNSHNFIRSFRKAEGITPGQYRVKYRGEE